MALLPTSSCPCSDHTYFSLWVGAYYWGHRHGSRALEGNLIQEEWD